MHRQERKNPYAKRGLDGRGGNGREKRREQTLKDDQKWNGNAHLSNLYGLNGAKSMDGSHVSNHFLHVNMRRTTQC